MLNTYIAETQRLLQYPGAPVTLYTTADLTTWINKARGQLAGESESIRVLGTVSTIPGTRNYAFTGINVGVSATTGVQAPLHVRSILYAVASGQRWVRVKSWEWFQLYKMNNPVPPSGAPTEWAQYAQGVLGSVFIDPIPDIPYVLTCDAVCYPIPLVDDTTVEALPFPWTDAVCYFAAYLALMSAQNQARSADANTMFTRYETFVQRARQFSTPSVQRYAYEQTGDPTTPAKLGLQQRAGGQQ